MTNDTALHVKFSREKMHAALDELQTRRYTVVGDLAIKAVEQAIEAAASLDGKHFHTNPRSAHGERIRWIKRSFPALSKDVDELWGAYGMLGYEGVDGERARKVISAMERVLREIGKETHLRFK